MDCEKPNKTVKILLKEFKSDKIKNANVIVDILERLKNNQSSTVTAAITGLHHIFTMLLVEGSMKASSKMPESMQSGKDKLSSWMYARYKDTHRSLLRLLDHEVQAVQELALCSIVKLMQTEGQHKLKDKENSTYPFPVHRLEPLITSLVSDSVDQRHLISLLLEYMECQDFMFYTLKTLKTIVTKRNKKDVSEIYVNNLFLLLEQIDIPEKDSLQLIPPKLLLRASDEEMEAEPPFVLPYTTARKAINAIWPEVMKYPMTHDLYRRCLILLPEKVMQHLDNPIILTDFFMESYNIGGAISLLSMQGVFILIHKHNLEYPDFYKKLYALLEPTVFHAKYKPRFFMLCDRFLASTHIPEYIVAAFIKRLARLALVAPTSCLVLLLKFIGNLLIRYPGMKKLIHNPNAKNFESDPYDAEEADPAKCKASQSSLWELATLEQHVIPFVSKSTNFMKKNLPDVEFDISEHVETTYDEIYERACKVTVRENVATTFHKPQGLFAHHDDMMSQDWSVL